MRNLNSGETMSLKEDAGLIVLYSTLACCVAYELLNIGGDFYGDGKTSGIGMTIHLVILLLTVVLSIYLFRYRGLARKATVGAGERSMPDEEALRHSEASYRAIFDAAGDAIIVHDMETGAIVDVNQRMCEMYGYTHDEAVALKCELACAGELPCPLDPALERFMESADGEPQFFQCEAKAKDGRTYWVDVSLKRAFVGGKERLLEVVRDISDNKKAEEERNRLEEQLRHAQKMEAVGQLAGGIAHDFNNILTAIIGYGHLLMIKMDDGRLRHQVEQILAASERAAVLTQGLLTFSRKQVINPQPVDLNMIVENLRKFLDRIIGEDIEMRIDLHQSALIVMVDSGQVEQVLMNLVTNARDAMPDGGLLAISTGLRKEGAKDNGREYPGVQVQHAFISVADTGTGMDEKTREKLFEPFFTTKEVGKGTGLGLSIAYGIIKQHGGYITAESVEGRGSAFRVYFPVVESRAATSVVLEPMLLQGGRETILVAEDDGEVRRLDRLLLEECGYTVIEAVDGEDAVEKFTAYADAIHLVILDVVMPRLNGREAFDAIRAIRPDVRVIFMSGYSAETISKKGVIAIGSDFVGKPIIPKVFTSKVREVLDRVNCESTDGNRPAADGVS
jgi:PAS domain S-box-containing protein